MSRHQIGVTTPLKPLQVATSKRGRDTVSLPSPQTRSRHKNQVATLLETNLCRDINFMSRHRFCHSEISRSRRQKPGCDLPHYYPCRDIISMSQRCFCPTKADQVATSLPGRDLMPNLNQTRSRPQNSPMTSFFFFFFKSSSSFPATSNDAVT